jgi:hypothetical protein
MRHVEESRVKCTRFWREKLEGKSTLARPRHRCWCGIRMNHGDDGCGVWSGFIWLRIGTVGKLL